MIMDRNEQSRPQVVLPAVGENLGMLNAQSVRNEYVEQDKKFWESIGISHNDVVITGSPTGTITQKDKLKDWIESNYKKMDRRIGESKPQVTKRKKRK
jgi:hypothetical protein